MHKTKDSEDVKVVAAAHTPPLLVYLCILLNPYHPSCVKSALCILSSTEAVLRLY